MYYKEKTNYKVTINIRIEDLLKIKNHFPRELLSNTDKVLCFFTAAFYGRNDVIDLYRGGIKDVTLVDIDEGKLNAMKSLYFSMWKYINGDAFKIAKELVQKKLKYDIVVCDPWSNMVEEVLNNKDFYKLANKYYIVTIDKEYLDKIGLEGNLESIKMKFPNVIDLQRRSGSVGGTYWLIMKGAKNVL